MQQRRKMSNEVTIKIGDSLPEDVISEILSWLPVKTLLRFKCVRKSWYAIITSSEFISKHLKNYYNNNGCDRFLGQYLVSNTGVSVMYEFSLDETSRVLSYTKLKDEPAYNSFICGPCNGIFYLDSYGYDHHRALWNPATNDLKTLPPLISKPNLPSHTCYGYIDYLGFGFDEATKDYKVIVVKDLKSKTGGERINYPSSVFVYSLRTDTWRYCGDLSHYRLRNNKCYICLDGVFYWLGSDSETNSESEVIISFDMATELYQEIQVPDYNKSIDRLAVYHDSLALLNVNYIGDLLEIWTLNERCWTKKFSIVSSSRKWGSPIGHWKNGKFLLGSWDRIIVLDPVTKEISEGETSVNNYLCEGIFVYRESLVSLTDRNGFEECREAKAQTSIKDSES